MHVHRSTYFVNIRHKFKSTLSRSTNTAVLGWLSAQILIDALSSRLCAPAAVWTRYIEMLARKGVFYIGITFGTNYSLLSYASHQQVFMKHKIHLSNDPLCREMTTATTFSISYRILV